MLQSTVFNLEAHIESIKPELKPPVGNKMIFGNKESVKFMCVGGPNARPDYHLEEGEELFYQLKGHMDLWIEEQGVRRGVRIEEGEMFLLPAHVPHSPQRYADTIGLVWERERGPDERDALRWYIDEDFESSDLSLLWEEYFHCFDLGVQLKPAITRYLESECKRTRVPPAGIPVPNPPTVVDKEVKVPKPFLLGPALAALPGADVGAPQALLLGEFEVMVYRSCTDAALSGRQGSKEVFLFSSPANGGEPAVGTDAASSTVICGEDRYTVGPGDALYLTVPDGVDLRVVDQGANAMLLSVHNKNYFPVPEGQNK